MIVGKVGKDLNLDEGKAAAEQDVLSKVFFHAGNTRLARQGQAAGPHAWAGELHGHFRR